MELKEIINELKELRNEAEKKAFSEDEKLYNCGKVYAYDKCLFMLLKVTQRTGE